MTEHAVARLRPDRVGSTVASLVRAFADDPLFNYLYPRPRVRDRAILVMMRRAVLDGLRDGEVWAPETRGVPGGAAVWLPPGAFPQPLLTQLRYLVAMTPVTLLSASRLVDGLRVVWTMERIHPRQPHWYLYVLGVDPALQGHGAGTQVLEPVLERCDAEGLPAYLETAKVENVTWYARRGFEVERELDLFGGGPLVWTMRRAPRPR